VDNGRIIRNNCPSCLVKIQFRFRTDVYFACQTDGPKDTCGLVTVIRSIRVHTQWLMLVSAFLTRADLSRA